MTLNEIATEIFSELEEPSDTSVVSIEAWLEANLGKLNVLLDTEFVADSTPPPDLDNQQAAIFKILYEIDYFKRKSRQNLGASAYTSVVEVKEGNRTVKRNNRTTIAKEYAAMVTELGVDLKYLIMAYKMNQSNPSQLLTLNPIFEESSNPYADRSDTRYDLR